jgi:hypothetical protein
MRFCWVLFTFNKYSEFLASLVICIHETVWGEEWILFNLVMAMIRACAKQVCSGLTSIILLFKWAMTASCLPFVLTRPWLTGILTECTTTTSLSRALNRVLDWATFSNTLQMMSTDNWSFRLKLIPIALFCR